ncbi:MAG: hypothetical protein HQL08_15440 [Nitrospirae bacterium]|nr:hypothetical protein [Nitrospirota bacterium]
MKRKLFYPKLAFVVVFSLHAVYSIASTAHMSQQWVQLENVNPFWSYISRQDYLLDLSYAIASAFTLYAVLQFSRGRKGSLTGVIGGSALTGFLYFAGCFLLGCCGSPMLIVYLNLFGSSFLGFTKHLTLALTIISVVIGYFWMERKIKTSSSCCEDNRCR